MFKSQTKIKSGICCMCKGMYLVDLKKSTYLGTLVGYRYVNWQATLGGRYVRCDDVLVDIIC